MTQIMTEKLHWVFQIDDGQIMYYLGDQDNKIIKLPTLINLSEEDFNLDRLKKQSVKQIERQKYQQQTKSTSHFSGKTKLRDVGGGSHGEKREWEVGQKGSYDDIDDGRSIKR